MTLPLTISMGDPAGIGPEIALAALAARPHALITGQPQVLAAAIARAGSGQRLRVLDDPGKAEFGPGLVNVIDTGPDGPPEPLGQVSARAGQAAIAAIEAGVRLCLSGRAAALVTAPIHKEALSAAGSPHPGHTEMLAALTGAAQVAMMLANNELRVVLVSIHCPLSEAVRRVTLAAELAAIRHAHDGARALGIAAPRVAVAGLNPHAGEGGLFGQEEIEVIAPAIAAARAQGIDVSGPWPGDTVFMQARQGRFDVVVAQYHDQGLIPIKYLGLEQGVNITLGLPIWRTSPDHGTAFDIAGQGIADPASMIAACDAARALANAAGG